MITLPMLLALAFVQAQSTTSEANALCILSFRPASDKERQLDLASRRKLLTARGYVFSLKESVEYAIDRELIVNRQVRGFQLLRKFLPKNDQPITIRFDELSADDKKGIASILTASPFQDVARKVLSQKGGLVAIVPTVDLRLLVNGQVLRVSPTPHRQSSPGGDDRAMSIEILDEKPGDAAQILPLDSEAMNLEYVGPPLPPEYRVRQWQEAMAVWVSLSKEETEKQLAIAYKQMEDVLGRNADKTPSAFSDLPQHVRDMIIEDVSMGLDRYGFGSKSEALRALDTATIESIRYTAKVIMSFRRKDGTETGGIFSLANFRF